MADEAQSNRPFWLPDTQGFLSVAIIALIAIVVLILLTRPPAIDERTSGVLMTIVGVLIACLKDVYSFFFGSSKGSDSKTETQNKIMEKLTSPPSGTGGSPAAVTAAAAVAAPPAVDAELDRRGVPEQTRSP